MKQRYPTPIEDSYIGPYLRKWRKRLRAAQSGHPYPYLESKQENEEV
jgi:hypothetical protein